MKVYALSGLTECGKRAAALYLETLGIKAYKIGDLLEPVYLAAQPDVDFQTWNFEQERTRPRWLVERFRDVLLQRAEEDGVERCSIDSLYGATMAREMSSLLSDDFVIIYIDAEFGERVKRQKATAGLETMDEALAIILEKDMIKKGHGNLHVREMAHVIIDNSGSKREFEYQLNSIFNK